MVHHAKRTAQRETHTLCKLGLGEDSEEKRCVYGPDWVVGTTPHTNCDFLFSQRLKDGSFLFIFVLIFLLCYLHIQKITAWRKDFSKHFNYSSFNNTIPSELWNDMTLSGQTLSQRITTHTHHTDEIIPYFANICDFLLREWDLPNNYPMVKVLWNNLSRGIIAMRWIRKVDYNFISYTDGSFKKDNAIWTTSGEGDFMVGRVLFVIEIIGIRHFLDDRDMHLFQFPQPPNVMHLMGINQWKEIHTQKNSNLLYFWNQLPIFKEETSNIHVETSTKT